MPTQPSPLPFPTKHVLVDYENLHTIDLGVFGPEDFNLTLLLGPAQKQLDADLVEKLLERAATVQLVRLASAAKNALDFALAYYLGQAVAAQPRSRFVIASKDKGYDPLIEHLRTREVDVCREADWGVESQPALPKLPTAMTKVPAPKAEAKPAGTAQNPAIRLLLALQKAKTARPGTRKSLVNWSTAHLGMTVTEAEAAVAELKQGGYLSIDARDRVTYVSQFLQGEPEVREARSPKSESPPR